MDICPDCFSAGISQKIRLQHKDDAYVCPDCGGAFIDNKWYSAAKYPNGEYQAWRELMGSKRISSAYKIRGVWHNRAIMRVG